MLEDGLQIVFEMFMEATNRAFEQLSNFTDAFIPVYYKEQHIYYITKGDLYVERNKSKKRVRKKRKY